MKTFVLAAVSSLTLTTSFAVLPVRASVWISSSGFSPSSQDTPFQLAQRRGLGDAQEVCVEAAEDRGLRVREVLSIEPVAGGAEVQMQVSQRQSSSFVVGCDYSSGTGNVELYRLEGVERNDPDSNSDSSDWRRSYSDGSSVRNQNEAEEIARAVVGQQLGIRDPYSDVVRIDDVDRTDSNRAWEVKGRVNGAPFVVRIRSSDAYVLGFDLF
ncbi:hypothetical protein [Leptolyngbya ohadii]|uniref:hypothetical protein n=1 Tax=Leptolyngbya ohadii TaxID=1962290 RepID=UPI000B59CB8B|nr:hypothetical protein [Leptolyngbya ohadii]